ncbi:MAG TPA: PilX N-terminal domain-containing pilus assembly protein [Frateuria sp.]|uniref:pilus assembly PilX family protein n=1 Tax=Frateuria sp. TaxID=2211372 RepID=UPI002D7F5062|nr:PilX N-terminal domain-containing pilus assembly protein [Frateuria sp.]HET6805379.1 PilX N-terminal domain-containing pilus assembly protein [Frateuria sp.]
MRRRHSRARSAGRRQRGAALVIALILLIVITLVGFAAVRGTILQQKMASNLYDREIAFQSAEAALRVAQQRILTHPGELARNCQAGGVVCEGNPFDDPNLDQDKIVTVPEGTASGQFSASSVASGQPQYVVENMGSWADPDSDTGFNQSANAAQYGAQGKSSTATFYRITARSGDPSTVDNRAVVTLQAMVKQN